MLEEFFKDLPGMVALSGAVATFTSSIISLCSYDLLKKEWRKKPLQIPDAPCYEPNSESHDLHIEHIDESLRKPIQEFRGTLESLPHINKDSFYRNIAGVHIIVYNKSLLTQIVSGSGFYNSFENVVKLLSNKRSTLTHELLHLSSNLVKDKMNSITGFQITDLSKRYDIGVGINEGYTSLLNERYFKEKHVSYLDLLILSELIELIVGQELMEKMYFENNLKGLCEVLNESMGIKVEDPEKDPAALLIRQIDFYHAVKYESPFISLGATRREFKKTIYSVLLILALASENAILKNDLERAQKLLNAIQKATPLIPIRKKKDLKLFLIKIQARIKELNKFGDLTRYVDGAPKVMRLTNVKNSLQNQG